MKNILFLIFTTSTLALDVEILRSYCEYDWYHKIPIQCKTLLNYKPFTRVWTSEYKCTDIYGYDFENEKLKILNLKSCNGIDLLKFDVLDSYSVVINNQSVTIIEKWVQNPSINSLKQVYRIEPENVEMPNFSSIFENIVKVFENFTNFDEYFNAFKKIDALVKVENLIESVNVTKIKKILSDIFFVCEIVKKYYLFYFFLQMTIIILLFFHILLFLYSNIN